MQILATKLEVVPIGAIKPYAGNSRRHSARQVDKIAASIAQFGFNAPILVDADGTIVAGHGRYSAAQRLGLVEVPVIQLGHLTDAQRKAYVIADNRIAEDASWDMTKLATEVQALQLEGFDLDATGLDDVDFSRIEMEVRKMAADLELIDQPPQPVINPAPAAMVPAAVPAGTYTPDTPQAPAPAPIQYTAAPMAPMPPAMVPLQMLLTMHQRDLVLARLNEIKSAHGLKTMGDAIFQLCKDAR